MKVFISADIEGVAGVSHVDQTRKGNSEYEQARRWMSAEVNAAIIGAFAGGAAEVHVADGHGDYRNLVLAILDPRATVTQGKPRLLGMFEGIQRGYDLVFMVGHHARAGSCGILAHTISGAAFAEISVNGRAVGEAELYGLLAGEYGAAVALLSGDDIFIEEMKAVYPDAEMVTTKMACTGASRAACHRAPERVYAVIEAAARTAISLRGKLKPARIVPPVEIGVRTQTATLADLFEQWPALTRSGPGMLTFEAPDMGYAIRMLNGLSAMAAGLR